jgi:hypothetical protein
MEEDWEIAGGDIYDRDLLEEILHRIRRILCKPPVISPGGPALLIIPALYLTCIIIKPCK